MKRLCCYLGIIALMSLSCNKWGKTDDIQIEVPEGKYLFSVQASQTTDTKTTYTGDKTFHWGIKDKISVLFHNTIEPYDNKFYTLSYISEADGTATFRGTIDDGYAIGAADGEHLKWALYPASDNHSYSAGTDPITFHIPALTDYTASGAEFSANLPMRAIGDGSNHFTFTHMAGTYKFVFTDIDESVSKVRLTVENQGSRALSGNIPTTGGSLYLAHDSSSGSRSIAFVENVSGSHSATFYVPYRGWHSDFQPVLTLSNEDNSYVLLEKTAKAAYNDDGKLTASVSHIIITQDFSAPGTGTPPFSQLIVTDGNMSDWDPAVNKKLSESNLATTTGNEKIKELKVAYDELYFYIYIKRNHTSELWGTSSYFYVFMDNDNDSLNGVEKNG